ncbi:MAG: FtsX-like permease family protein [Patescibacteria group bacterium]
MRLIYFSLKDIARRPTENILVLVGISFAVAAIFILSSLRLGITNTLYESAVKKNPLSQITIRSGGSSFLKLLESKQKTLGESDIEEIKKNPAVRIIAPHMLYQNLASVELELMDQTLQTDSLIFGISKETIEDDLPAGIAWKDPSDGSPVPVLISRKLIDFYNFSLASSAGLPQLDEDSFKDKTIKILPGYSSFFSANGEIKKVLEGRIVGFSDKVDLIGATIPIETVEILNAEEGRAQKSFNKLFVTLDSPASVDLVTQELEEKGYRVTSLQREFKEVSRSLKYVEIIIFVLSGIILVSSILLIGNSIWMTLLRRTKELGIMRAIGATRGSLYLIFFIEAVITGFIGGIIGTLIGKASTFIFQKLLANQITLASVSIEDLFASTWSFSGWLLLVSVALSILASGIPIFIICKKEPRMLFIK